jgi:stringent starvation protein B
MDNVIEWLNENELRAYPLIEGERSEMVPENFLLDLILLVNQNIADLASVRLLNIATEISGISVQFSGEGNTFFVPKNQVYPVYVRNQNGSLAVFGEGVEQFINNSTTSVVECNIPVEPSTIFKFDLAWLGVSKITTYKNYQSIENSYTPLTPLELSAIGDYSLTGDVEFYPGYNYKIDFNDGKINMAAGFKLGMAMDCTTHFISPELKDCDKIISYINGIPPDTSGAFRFTSGENIYMFDGNTVAVDIPDTNPKIDELYYSQGKPPILKINPNTLFIGLTFLESDLCSPIQLLPTNN